MALYIGMKKSKSDASNSVRVQVPPNAPIASITSRFSRSFFNAKEAKIFPIGL